MHTRVGWAVVASVAWSAAGCDGVKAIIVENYPNAWDDELGTAQASSGPTGVIQPIFDGADTSRPPIPVALKPVITGLEQPTDIQFPPGHDTIAVVAQKEGRVRVFSVATEPARDLGELLKLKPPSASEQGVLGLAFDPAFGPAGGKLYIHHTVRTDNGNAGRLSVTDITVDGTSWAAGPLSTILELPQPYANHNGGQLQFGPDGYLYVGFGDGGWRDDPHGNGQDTTTWLGKMLRIDVHTTDPGKAYAVPKDNPFVGKPDFAPEIWAYGLRNPWSFSFAPDGRLIVADVGQNLYEEVDIVAAGDNLGWKHREADHCFEPKLGCTTDGLVDPIYTYDHSTDGASITGGYVYTGSAIPALKGKYVFGDFVSGRIWALDLPAAVPGEAKASALGRFEALLVTFGRDPSGEVLVADFGRGNIYRLVQAGG
jgi:glucose/arabinose dehydrogenase